MLSKIYSMGLFGIDGYMVSVECNIRNKLFAFDIVGCPMPQSRNPRNECAPHTKTAGLNFPIWK